MYIDFFVHSESILSLVLESVKVLQDMTGGVAGVDKRR